MDEDLFDWWIDENEKFETCQKAQEEQQELPEEIIIDTQEQVGSIVEYKNERWLVLDSRYLTANEAIDMEDANDANVSVGWYTTLRSVHEGDKTLEAVAEQMQSGLAQIVYRENGANILFFDEQQVIPLDDLAYNGEIGLYQKSQFPSLEREV